MSQIIVITLATNIYNSYIDKQIETIENFFPELHKQFIIITDQYKENYKLSDDVDIYYYHIPDMPYNITCLCKTIYGVDALETLKINYDNDDLFFFLDADSIYLNKGIDFYRNFYNKIKEFDLIISTHLLFYHPYHRQTMCKLFGERESKFAGYFDVTEKNIYICSNIFGGKIKALKMLNEDIKELFKKDMSIEINYRHFPCTNEETYINKIVNDQINELSNKYKIMLTQLYVANFKEDEPYFEFFGDMENQEKNFQYVLIQSKYDNNRKTTKPNVPWYYDKKL